MHQLPTVEGAPIHQKERSAGRPDSFLEGSRARAGIGDRCRLLPITYDYERAIVFSWSNRFHLLEPCWLG
jgi:hypothetical protein